MGRFIKKGDLVYLTETNSIGFIIDKGTDNGNEWSRTDVDGVRDDSDLIKITKHEEIVTLIMKHGVIFIAPSTKSAINKHFNIEVFDEKLLV